MKQDELHPGVLEIVDVKANVPAPAPRVFKVGKIVGRSVDSDGRGWTEFEKIEVSAPSSKKAKP